MSGDQFVPARGLPRPRRTPVAGTFAFASPVVYVAGAYGDPDPEGIRRNVCRALMVGRLAAHEGFTPIVPHAPGWLGVFGTPDESDSVARQRALDAGRDLAEMVGAARGALWVINGEDGASEGVALEIDAYGRAGGARLWTRPWSGWAREIGLAGVAMIVGAL